LFQALTNHFAAIGLGWHALCCMSIEPKRKAHQPTQPLGELEMKSTLTIKDLALDNELGRKAMSAVRGGKSDQANGTNQLNVLEAIAPVDVANGAKFMGSGPTTIQVHSDVDQTASNYSDSYNYKDAFGFFGFPR
jgi:hypothetical protein